MTEKTISIQYFPSNCLGYHYLNTQFFFKQKYTFNPLFWRYFYFDYYILKSFILVFFSTYFHFDLCRYFSNENCLCVTLNDDMAYKIK